MHQDGSVGSEVFVNERDSRIHNLRSDPSRVFNIHEIQNQAMPTSGQQILGMRLVRGAALITKSLAMMRLFTGMNDSPRVWLEYAAFKIGL
jgi:hypothetical protein